MSPEYEEALRALARAEGRSPDELLLEMLRSRAGAPAALPAASPPGHSAEIVRREPVALQPKHAGVPMPQTPSQAEALAQWIEAEEGPAGVFGPGGMSSGGIFGPEPVATGGYDPRAEQRSREAILARMAPELLRAAHQQRYQPPPPPPPEPPRVRMVQTVTVYEGPAIGAMPPQLPWPWSRR